MSSIELYRNKLSELSFKKELEINDLILASEFLNYYFTHNRPQAFSDEKLGLSRKFEQLLNLNKDVFNGINFASAFFLFNYTHSDNYTNVQNDIHDYIALPYQNWLMKNFSSFGLKPAHYMPHEEFLYIVRHATTSGPYAPGQSAFIQCKYLLEAGNRVTLLVMGPTQVTQDFANLAAENKNFTLLRMRQNVPFEIQFNTLQSLAKNIKPKLILTEIEFELVSALSIVGCSSPIFLMSAGFFNLPWYDKLGLFDLFKKNNMSKRNDDIFYFPMSIDKTVLAPQVNKADVENARSELGFSETDFIFGCFARKEKFSDAYINLCKRILDHIPNSKLLLAGPNDDRKIKSQLADELVKKKAQILGASNVHLLGQLLDVGLETFPCASGSSILELMAKGKPVVSVTEFEDTDIHRLLRVKENVTANADLALKKIVNLARSRDEQRLGGEASEALINKLELESKKKFLDAIIKTLGLYFN